MTPQEAKTKIENLLNLGILYGVKVESSKGEITRCYKIDFEPALPDHIWYTGKRVIDRTPYPEMFSFTTNPNDIPPFLRDVAAIYPIPLEPKLLEVGTKVEVIGGDYEYHTGVIDMVDEDTHSYLISGIDGEEMKHIAMWVSSYNVVPESLLVEEEEEDKLLHIRLAHVKDMVCTVKEKDAKQALEKAGYKLTKE